MAGWDLLVDRADLRRTTLVDADPDVALAEGEALLAVESFALTANNITYGAAGDMIGYWKFFPAPEGPEMTISLAICTLPGYACR